LIGKIDLLFYVTQLTDRNNAKSCHTKRKPIFSERRHEWKRNGKI